MTTRSETTNLPTVADAPPIPGLRFRRPTGDAVEYEALARLQGRAAAADSVPWRPTAEHIREELERPERLDLARDVILAEVDGELIAAAGTQRVVRDGVVVFDLGGDVDPAWRRRGLGRALFGENVRRATERAAKEPPGQAVAFGAFVEATQTGHRILLTEAGFEEIRWFFLMRRDLAEPIPDAPLPDGIEIRPVTPDQARAIFDAEVEAFRDHWGARVKTDADYESTISKAEYDPSIWVVAWDGDEVAGVVQNWIWPEENDALGVRRGWLEHISVRRPWRRRGLARAITAASLRRFRDLGMADAMLGVDTENANGALGLYERLGFVAASQASAFRRSLARD